VACTNNPSVLHVVLVLVLGPGCARENSRVRAAMHDDIEARTSGQIDVDRDADEAASLPPGIALDDGLTRDEAVVIALWNNPSLRVELARLEAMEGEVAGAGRPSNPNVRLLFPIGVGAFSTLLIWPIEALAIAPGRVKAARRKRDASAAGIVQASLDLSRDVRLAHADWVLAHERVVLRTELAAQRHEFLTIVAAQASFGDVSESDTETARAEAALADDELARAEQERAIAESRLRTLMGYGLEELALGVPDEPLDALPGSPLASLSERAEQERPDLQAAVLELERAQAQLRLERAALFNLSAVSQSVGPAWFLGMQATLPIFDQNQAGRARARAEIEAAKWRRRALRERIAGEVREAHVRFEMASSSHKRYLDELVGSRERAAAAARDAFELGEVDYTVVLLAEQNLDAARLRLAELGADVRRAHAELERALGGRLSASTEAQP
jgi:cobalt-zinc-cadmium efflux system outer membrane protein